MVKSEFDRINIQHVRNILQNCQIYHIVVNSLFRHFIKVLEVDVFEHHRCCDEFSNIVKRRFFAT